MKKNSYHKTYLQVFFIIFLIISTSVLFVNFNVDPSKIYPEKFKVLNDKKLNVNEVVDKLVKNKNGVILQEGLFNDRDLAKSFTKNINKVDCIIFGASHVRPINLEGKEKVFSTTCKSILNFGISGGVLEDYIALSKNINLKNKKRKKIFISIHPWTLNLNKDNRWYRNIDDYNFIIKKITNSNEEKMKKNLYNNLRIKNLFNFNYFVQSLKNIKEKNNSLSFINNLNKKQKLPILLYDGSIIKPDRKFLNPKSFIEKGFADYKIEKNSHIDENAVFILTQYIKYFEKNFDIIFLLSPYHPEVWKNDYLIVVEAMMVVEKRAKEIAKENKINVIGSFDPRKLGCNESEFFDLLHPKKSCLSKIEKLRLNFK